MVSNGMTRITECCVRSVGEGSPWALIPLPGTGEASRTVVMALIPAVTLLSPWRGMFTSWIPYVLVQMLKDSCLWVNPCSVWGRRCLWG